MCALDLDGTNAGSISRTIPLHSEFDLGGSYF